MQDTLLLFMDTVSQSQTLNSLALQDYECVGILVSYKLNYTGRVSSTGAGCEQDIWFHPFWTL